jgi:integrase
MKLTDLQVRNAQPGEKLTKLSDGKGLYLEITPKGSKRWRFRYRYLGKENMLSLGLYPETSLKDARDHCHEARRLLAKDINPSQHRKALKTAELGKANFETVAREWFTKHAGSWAANHADKIISRLKRNVFPFIGEMAIDQIKPPALLNMLTKIQDRGALETARRVLSYCGRIFRYAVAAGLAERDITADLRGMLPTAKTKHFAAIVDPCQVGKLLRMIDAYEGTLIVHCALRLAPLVFVRPSELRMAKWDDIDFAKAQWRYLVTKTQTQHIVPLSRQAIAILQELYPVTKDSVYVFPNARSNQRPMSDCAILVALRNMGIPKEEMSGHGFRAMARTILDEELGIRPDFIEHQLAHAVRDPNGRAYNRTAHLAERHKMMQTWADYLDTLKQNRDMGSNVVKLSAMV